MNKILSIALAAFVLAAPAFAQDSVQDGDCVGAGCDLKITTTITVPTLMSAQFSGLNQYGNPLNPTYADFVAGYRAEDEVGGYPRPKVIIASNVPWQVSIKALTNTFTYSGTATDPAKPASDMQVKMNGTYTALSTSDQVMATGAPTNPNHKFSLDQKVLWSFSKDAPGTYALGMQLTLAAQ